jgi:hypothetical protein
VQTKIKKYARVAAIMKHIQKIFLSSVLSILFVGVAHASVAANPADLVRCQGNVIAAVDAQSKIDFPGLTLSIFVKPDLQGWNGGFEIGDINAIVTEGDITPKMVAVYTLSIDEVCSTSIQGRTKMAGASN